MQLVSTCWELIPWNSFWAFFESLASVSARAASVLAWAAAVSAAVEPSLPGPWDREDRAATGIARHGRNSTFDKCLVLQQSPKHKWKPHETAACSSDFQCNPQKGTPHLALSFPFKRRGTKERRPWQSQLGPKSSVSFRDRPAENVDKASKNSTSKCTI